MVDLPIVIDHLPEAIAFAIGPKSSVHPKSFGVPAFAEAMPLVVLEIAGVYGSIGVGHDTKAVPLVGGGVTFSLVRGVSIIDDYDGGV